MTKKQENGGKHYYEISTGLAHSADKNNYFSSDKEAWNTIAKDFDLHYKTGGRVQAILYKYEMPIRNLHPQLGCNDGKPGTCRVPIAEGYISHDWDGKPWNNKTYCGLCGVEITPKMFRDNGHCKECKAVIHSLWAWSNPLHSHGMGRAPERVEANITSTQLRIIKEKYEDWYKDAVFLIRDGTLTLINNDPPFNRFAEIDVV